MLDPSSEPVRRSSQIGLCARDSIFDTIIKDGDSAERREKAWIEASKAPEPEKRVSAMRNLRVMCEALGPQRTRRELVPYLKTTIHFHDQVSLTLASNVQVLCQHMGGRQHYAALLELFEALCRMDRCVGDAAVDSLLRIAADLPAGEMDARFVPLVVRLAGGAPAANDTSTAAKTVVGKIARTTLPVNAVADKKDARTPDKTAVMRPINATSDTSPPRLFANAAAAKPEGNAKKSEANKSINTCAETPSDVTNKTTNKADSVANKLADTVSLRETVTDNRDDKMVSPTTTYNAVVEAKFSPRISKRSSEISSIKWSRESSLEKSSSDRSSEKSVEKTTTGAGSNVAARIAACSLVELPFKSVGMANRGLLTEIVFRLCEDVDNMVRRVAVNCFRKLVHLLDHESLMKALELVGRLIHFDQDVIVRQLAFRALVKFAEHIKPVEVTNKFMPVLQRALNDKAEKVRITVALKLFKLQHLFGPELAVLYLTEPLMILLQDSSTNVRDKTVRCLPAIVEAFKHFDESCAKKLIHQFLKQFGTSDDIKGLDKSLRKAIVVVTIPLANLSSAEEYDQFLSLYICLLNDEDETVQMEVLESLPQATHVFGHDKMTTCVFPCIITMVKKVNSEAWRERVKFLLNFPSVAQACASDYFVKHFLKSLLEFLANEFQAVRREAVIILARICNLYGIEWSKTHVFNHVIAQEKNERFTNRLTFLRLACELQKLFQDDNTLNNVMLNSLLDLENDRVPNVRLKLCETLSSMTWSDDVQTKQIRPLLERLSTKDTDPDVVQYARKAMNRIGIQLASPSDTANSTPISVMMESSLTPSDG